MSTLAPAIVLFVEGDTKATGSYDELRPSSTTFCYVPEYRSTHATIDKRGYSLVTEPARDSLALGRSTEGASNPVKSQRPVRAVLFDMTGTLHPQHQFRRGVELTAYEISLGLSSASASDIIAAFGAAFRHELAKRVEVQFYLMTEVYQQAFLSALAVVGLQTTDTLVSSCVESLRRNLTASVGPQDGAIEVLSSLRARGLTTGIVSVNDESDLKLWIEACGFETHVDFALSSEAARSCKPDLEIFGQAIALTGRDADEIVFVGDSREMDIRGANRTGMRSVLTMQEVFTPPGQPPIYSPEDSPDFTIGHIRELLDLVLST